MVDRRDPNNNRQLRKKTRTYFTVKQGHIRSFQAKACLLCIGKEKKR